MTKPAHPIDVEHAKYLITEASFPHNGITSVHTRRAGIGHTEPLLELLEDLNDADLIVWRDSIIGPVVFARLPGDRGVSVDVNPAPVGVSS